MTLHFRTRSVLASLTWSLKPPDMSADHKPKAEPGSDSPLPDIKNASLDADPVSSSDQEDLALDGINERALLRKIDWRLLPAVGILYLLSFLDRSNVGNARIEGLATDLHMTGNQYLTGLTLYFIGYVIFEVRLPPSPPLANTNLVTDSLQHHPQANYASVLAAHADHSVGHCCHSDGSGPEPRRLLCGPLLPRCHRVRTLSWCRLLFLHVVQATGETVPNLVVLQCCRPRWFVWWYFGLCRPPLELRVSLNMLTTLPFQGIGFMRGIVWEKGWR